MSKENEADELNDQKRAYAEASTASLGKGTGSLRPLPKKVNSVVQENMANFSLLASTCKTQEACDALGSQLANIADYLTTKAEVLLAKGDKETAADYLAMAADDRRIGGYASSVFHPQQAINLDAVQGNIARDPVDIANGQQRVASVIYGQVYSRAIAHISPAAVSVWSDPLMRTDAGSVEFMEAYNYDQERRFNIATAVGGAISSGVRAIGSLGSLFRASEAGPSFLAALTRAVEMDAASIIAAGDGKASVAVSRAGQISTGIQSDKYVNLSAKIPDFVENGGINMEGTRAFKVVDSDVFIAKLVQIYENKGMSLNSVTEGWIRGYVAEGRVIDTAVGIPGAHAEVVAVNALLNQSKAMPALSDIAVSTFKTTKGNGVGLPFEACTSCGGILPNLIMTGRRKP